MRSMAAGISSTASIVRDERAPAAVPRQPDPLRVDRLRRFLDDALDDLSGILLSLPKRGPGQLGECTSANTMSSSASTVAKPAHLRGDV